MDPSVPSGMRWATGEGQSWFETRMSRTEKHERSPGLRPAMLGSMKARPREASADIMLASSSIRGAGCVQQANVRRSHIDEAR